MACRRMGRCPEPMIIRILSLGESLIRFRLENIRRLRLYHQPVM